VARVGVHRDYNAQFFRMSNEAYAEWLCAEAVKTGRVRIEGDRAKLTIKGVSVGLTRSEFEYPIPVEDAGILLDNLCEQPLIDKHRHKEVHGGKTWEIDVFHGDNDGLVVADPVSVGVSLGWRFR